MRYTITRQVIQIIGTLWQVGRRAPRTRYRRTLWAAGDTAVLIGAAVAIIAFTLPLPGIDRAVLAYYPYPLLHLPRFDPVLGFATLGLAWPAAVLRANRTLDGAPAPSHQTDDMVQ